MFRILIIILATALLSCSSTKKMTDEQYEKYEKMCLQKAEEFSGFTMDDLILEFGRPAYQTTDIANNTIIVFSCVESPLYIHFTFNQFGEITKYEVKKTMLAN